MSKPLDITAICAELGRIELEFGDAASLVRAIASAVKARLVRYGASEAEILDKLESLDIASDEMEAMQRAESEAEDDGDERSRSLARFARETGAALELGVR